MFNFRESKLGMTLVEMVISLVILGILTTSTMGIIISSNNIFVSTSNAALDRQVGGHVFETLSSILKYSTHMSIYDADKAPTNDSSQCVSLEISDDETNSGILYFRHKGATDPVLLYENSFYGNRTVQYSVQPAGNGRKHIELTVRVYRGGKMRYELTRVIKCVNLDLISTGADANFIKNESTEGSINQYISFSVDEQLISGGADAFSLEYKVSEYMAKYNRIQKEYTSKLQAVYGEVNRVIGNSKDEDGYRVYESDYTTVTAMREKAVFGDPVGSDSVWEASEEASADISGLYNSEGRDASVYQYNNLRQHYQERIEDLLQFVPTNAGFDVDNPFYGVVATKEELYTGFMLTYYDEDGNDIISKEEYPSFSDPDTFFNGTSIASYISNSSDNKMVIMTYFRENTDENYTSLFNSTEKNVYTYSGTPEKGYYNSGWVITDPQPKGYGKILTSITEGKDEITGWNKTGLFFTIDLQEYAGAAGNVKAGILTAKYRCYYAKVQEASDSNHNMPIYTESDRPYEYDVNGAQEKWNKNAVRGSAIIGDLKSRATEISGDNYIVKYDNLTYYIYPKDDMPEGWYYYVNDNKYHFFYIESSESYNDSNIAVAGITASTSGYKDNNYMSKSRILIGIKDDSYLDTRLNSIDYAQANYRMLESGAQKTYPTAIYSVSAHQYTDYVLYGTDWNSWFNKNSTEGLLNSVLTAASNLVTSLFTGSSARPSNITQISSENANQALGYHGKYSIDTIDSDVASYNLAWTVYSPKRGTWYYLPDSSTRISAAASKISWISSKSNPIPLDVDLKNGKTWSSSTMMVGDIDNRKLSSKGLFNLVDTTSDVRWVPLPTGNQVDTSIIGS